MLIEQIKKDRITAMKAKNKVAKDILTTLVGELEGAQYDKNHKGNGITDELVVQSCKKFIVANKEMLQHVTDADVTERLTNENVVLTGYLPKQLTEDQLRTLIIDTGETNIGGVMKYLKSNYNGQFDGKLASQICRELM